MRGYYGKAAPYLTAYLDLVQKAFLKSGKRLPCFGVDLSYLGIDEMNQATQLFDKAAEAVASDAEISARVRRERLSLDHAWLILYRPLKRKADKNHQPFLGPKDPADAVKQFDATVHEFKNEYVSEGGSYGNYMQAFMYRFAPHTSVTATDRPATIPQECKGLNKDEWVDIQDCEFRLFNPPVMAQYIDDPKASDGRSARMPGNHHEWAVQYGLDSELEGKWHCYASIRCETKATTGTAFTMGIYDVDRAASLGDEVVKIEDAGDNEYHTYDLGVHDLTPSAYFWVAPPGDANAVTAVYVDRFFLIKAK